MSELFAGATRAEAARKAGVSPATLYAWLKLGREGRPAFAPLAEAFAGVEQRRGAWRSIIGTKKRRGFWSPVR